MEIKSQPKLAFKGVDIVEINVKVYKQHDLKEKINLDVKLSPKVFYPENDKKIFKIIMDIELSSVEHFLILVKAIGHFELSTEIIKELKKQFINSNAPAIMFPYIRSFISTLTANMGNSIGALTIPTQFFKGELVEVGK